MNFTTASLNTEEDNETLINRKCAHEAMERVSMVEHQATNQTVTCARVTVS